MKREIKFRAWLIHGIENQNTINRMVYESNYVLFGWLHDGANLELMQYTGLKDKEGEEIYEHDIILDHVSGKIWVVKFGQAWPYRFTGWYCDYKGEGVQAININNDADDDRNHATEVIGNIYENPELLK